MESRVMKKTLGLELQNAIEELFRKSNDLEVIDFTISDYIVFVQFNEAMNKEEDEILVELIQNDQIINNWIIERDEYYLDEELTITILVDNIIKIITKPYKPYDIYQLENDFDYNCDNQQRNTHINNLRYMKNIFEQQEYMIENNIQPK